jgi:HPt (histidine-containing phosphotransfer) domain-containing protein
MTEPIRSPLRDDPALADLVREYALSLPARVEDLRAALAAGDRVRLGRLAHQTHGSAGMCGFAEVSETAALLEGAVREGYDLDMLREFVDELDDLTKRVLRGLDLP